MSCSEKYFYNKETHECLLTCPINLYGYINEKN